ncbi:MAG: lipopolysaccharide heptosyltransferase family protein, partial [Psychromonas sp.]
MRNNKRIGNILFLITFARQTRLAYPDAKVDLMLTMPSQGTYIEGLGLDNIFYSHFSFKGIFKWLGLIKKLNTVKYDLILAPNCCASDSITTAMIASKNKVSAYNERRVWAFPHAQHVTSSREHAAHSSLAILESLGHQLCYPLNHNLPFSEDEIEQGANLSREYKTEEDSVDMVFFRGARGVKLLSEEVWETLLLKFESGTDKKINWIEVLSPDIKEPLRDNIKTFVTSNMRVLGTFLKTFDGFICCDTGPLHLADAADVKCI